MYLAHVLLKRSCSVFKSDNPLGVINLMKKTNFVQSNAMPKASKTVLKLSTLSLSMLCLTMTHAAENESTTEDKPAKVVKVAVTGSSIKGVAAQSASPITVIRADDLVKQGVTTVEEALTKVSANQAGFSTAQNVGASNTEGSSANLRALGTDKTLILLNGRRLAYSPFSTSTTNLNIIPMAMVDRIEILRDGASAIYGADAIAGVINFITKKSFEGLNISAGFIQPEQSGGDKQDISIFGGYGDLDEQGFNLMGVIDYRRSNDIMAKDRKISRRGGLIPELGIDGTSANGFPANFRDPVTGALGNPYGDLNCNNAPNTIADGGLCYLNTQALIGIVPKTETISALGRGTFKLNDNFNAIAEYVYSRNEVTTSIAPDVYSRSVTLPSTSPYYPGNGITPEVAGLSGNPLELYLRSQAGNRMSNPVNESHRALISLEGEAYGWDINTGLSYARSEATDGFAGGYLNKSKLQDALNNGTINPFGPSENQELWKSFEVKGDTNTGTLTATTFDFTISLVVQSTLCLLVT